VSAGTYQPGDRCDRYRIVRLMAAGGAGEVYEAVHDFTGRTVALKCLLLKLAQRDDLKERMRLEAVVLCKIRHANVVSVYDAGITADGTVWIAMELLEGQTLRALLRVGRQPLPQALYYAAAIADGVQAAHELHVVHRDLKPENVFVTCGNEVKVLDLGTAKFHGYGAKTTERMRTLGTPAYMSPEHLRGDDVDVRADIYALGVIAYELLAGAHPFASATGSLLAEPLELGAMHLHAEPPALTARIQGFPDDVWQVVRAAMHKDRARRYPSMAQFSAALRAARTRFLQQSDPVFAASPHVPRAVAPVSLGPLVSQPTPAYPAVLPVAAPMVTLPLELTALSGDALPHDTEPLAEAQHADTEPAVPASSLRVASPEPAAYQPAEAGARPAVAPETTLASRTPPASVLAMPAKAPSRRTLSRALGLGVSLGLAAGVLIFAGVRASRPVRSAATQGQAVSVQAAAVASSSESPALPAPSGSEQVVPAASASAREPRAAAPEPVRPKPGASGKPKPAAPAQDTLPASGL
jgi:serine/threonine-protein kinase